MRSGPSFLVALLLVVAVVASTVALALAFGVLPPLTGAGPTATPTGSLPPTGPPTPSPSPSASPTAVPTPSPSPSPSARPTPGGTYVVQPGDTLFTIGELFGIPWQLIAQANDLPEPYYIYPQQELIIPPLDSLPSNDPCAPVYIVRPGDTFYDIAYDLGVSATDLEAANPEITDINNLKVGDRLNVPPGPDCASPSASPSSSP